MDKKDIARAICEIRCVCALLEEEEELGVICDAMAENIIGLSKETPQNPEHRFMHLSEESIG